MPLGPDDFDIDSPIPERTEPASQQANLAGEASVGQKQPATLPSAQPFSPVFDLGFQQPEVQEFTPLIQRALATTVQLENQIRDCVQRVFANARVINSRCRGVINDCVNSYLNVVRDLCDNDQGCIAREIGRLESVAWQIASKYGCFDRDEPVAPPEYVPPPIYIPPPSPEPSPVYPAPPADRPIIGPPTFPPPIVRPLPPPVEKPFPPRPQPPDKFPPRPQPPEQPPLPPIGRPPLPKCPPDSPLECWLGLPPAPPRIVPLLPGECELLYNVQVAGDLMHVFSSWGLHSNCNNINEWIRGANQIQLAQGYVPLGVEWTQRDPVTGISRIMRSSARKALAPPPPIQPPSTQPPGAPPQQCQQCCCCPCECEEKKPPEEPPEEKPPEEKPGDFCCMKQVGGACYVLGPGQNQRSSTDTIVSCHASAADAQRACEAACPPPERPQPPENGEPPTSPTLDWCSLDVANVAQFATLPSNLGPIGAILHTLGIENKESSLVWKVIGEAIKLLPGGSAISLVPNLSAAVINIARTVDTMVGQLVCVDPKMLPLHGIRSILNFLAKYVGDNFAEISRPMDHWAHFLCPTEIPDAASINAAFLGNQISPLQWNTFIRANNQCVEPMTAVLRAQRSKPVPIELRELRRRGIISESEYNGMMRQLGYLDQPDIDKVWSLSEVVPPYQDLVRMMVRDVERAPIVAKFGMDDLFGQAYAGQLQKWFHDQGITDQVAKYLWRAHWDIPSPTQLYTMFHRFSRLPAADPLHTDIATVREALVQQDFLPYWIDRLVESSKLPINRSDATQAYFHGVMDDAALLESYQVNGYDANSAQVMVKKTYAQRLRRYWRSPPVRAFLRAGLSEDDTRTMLAAEGLDVPSIDTIIARSKVLRRADFRTKCIAAIRKRFFAGEFDIAGSINELVGYGLDQEAAVELTEFWECERKTKGKHFGAAVLCRLLEQGLITQANFIERARRLGWNQEDALILASDCLARINLRATKAAELAARKVEATQRRNMAELKRGLRETADAQRNEQRILEAARKASERRTDMLLRAAEKMADKLSTGVADTAAQGKRIWDLLHFQNRILIDDALQAVVRAAEIYDAEGGFTWQELAIDYATGEQAIEGTANGSTSILNGNGETV